MHATERGGPNVRSPMLRVLLRYLRLDPREANGLGDDAAVVSRELANQHWDSCLEKTVAVYQVLGGD